MDGMPAILSQGLAQDWRFVLSKEKNVGYKFSMEMPKILDALRTIPPINSLLSTMDTTFGKGKFKFGLAIAPRGELEIFGASLKDLYDRLGVAEKFGVVMGKAKDMVNKVSEISGLDDNDNPVNKAVAKVSGAADTVVKYIDDAQKFLDDAEIKVKSTVLNFLDKFEKKSLKGLSDAIGKVTQFLADVKNKVGETDMAGMVDDALDTAKEALFDMAKDAVGTDTMDKVTNFLNELREYAKTFKAIVAMIPPKALAAMKKKMGGGSVSSGKLRTVLRGVQMIKAKVQALAAIVDAAMEKVKGVVAGVLDQGKTLLLGALDQGKAKFNEVATKLDEKLKRMWKMARSTANTCFSKFAEKKKSVYATVDKYLTPVQKAISGVKDFLAKIKGGELGDFVVGIVQNEVYTRIDTHARKLWFMKPTIAEVWDGFVPASADLVCPV